MKLLAGPVEPPESSPTFPYILAAALIQGLLVAWSPVFASVTAAHVGILLTAIAWILLGRKFHLSKILIPVALIGSWGLFQLLANTTSSQWLTRQSTSTWFTCAVAFLLGSTILSDWKALHRFLGVLFWATAGLALIAILQLYVKPVQVFGLFPAESTVIGTFLYKNQFAAMLELAAPIALYRMLEREGEEWIGAGAFAILFGAAVGASSRAGVMLLAGELAVALFIAARRRILPWRNLLILSGGLVAMVSVASIVAGTDTITEHFQEKSPYSVRQKLLASTLRMIKKKPLTGYGFGTWPEIYPGYATFDSSLYANQAHNDWAQWTAEGGIPFALLLFGLVVWIARPAIFSIWGMGLVAVMVQSFVDYPTREPVLAIFWFLLAGAVHRHAGERLLPRETD